MTGANTTVLAWMLNRNLRNSGVVIKEPESLLTNLE
jgi:hypothetical protein